MFWPVTNDDSGEATVPSMFGRPEEIASDGVAMAQASLADRPHPRFYGTFPRVLGRYARDTGLLPLAEAVRQPSPCLISGPRASTGCWSTGSRW
jgi:N-acyl-D-amino-acid deacylase